MRTHSIRSLASAGVALLALQLAACGDKGNGSADTVEAAAEEGREVYSQTVTDAEGKTAEVTVRQTGEGAQNVTITGADGTKVVSTMGADAAKYLPKWLKLYPGAQVTGGMAGTSDSGGGGGMVTLTTRDTPDRVIAFYKQLAAANGYKQQADATMGAMRMYAATKGDDARSGFQVQTTPAEGGGTAISLITSTG